MGWLSTPKPDPAVGQAAMQQAELSREMAGVAREELAFGREQYERFAPMDSAGRLDPSGVLHQCPVRLAGRTTDGQHRALMQEAGFLAP